MKYPMNDKYGMNEEDHNPDKLERLLDESLGRYSQVEPLNGIEERILARLATAAEEPRAWWAPFVWEKWGAAVTAIVLVAGIALGMFLVTRPTEDTEHVAEVPPIGGKSGPVIAIATAPLPAKIPQVAFRAPTAKLAQVWATNRVVRVGPSAEVGTKEIKQEVFPTPVPLSAQELLALAYVRFAKGQEVAAKGPGLGELSVAPVVVPEIKIEGLAPELPLRSSEQFFKPASIQEGRR